MKSWDEVVRPFSRRKLKSECLSQNPSTLDVNQRFEGLRPPHPSTFTYSKTTTYFGVWTFVPQDLLIRMDWSVPFHHPAGLDVGSDREEDSETSRPKFGQV